MDIEMTCEFVCREVGANVGRLRNERDISQAQLARMIGVNRPNLCNFENGRQNVSIDYLVKIAEGLDVPLVEFFAGLENARPSECAAVRVTDAGE